MGVGVPAMTPDGLADTVRTGNGSVIPVDTLTQPELLSLPTAFVAVKDTV